MTDESLLETMFLHFAHKVDLRTQVYFAIVINQCKRSVIWTPYNSKNKSHFFKRISVRFKEVYTDLNSTLISCYRLASITVQMTFSFKRKAIESMDVLRYQRPHSLGLHSLLMRHRSCCASCLQKVIPSLTHNSLAISKHNKRLRLVVILAPWARLCLWIDNNIHTWWSCVNQAIR